MDAREIAKETRTALKTAFPGWKFSITSDYNSMTVAVMSGPESPFVDEFDYGLAWGPQKRRDAYAQLNHFYIEHYNDTPYMNVPGYRPEGWYSGGARLTSKAAKMLTKVVEIANAKNYDKSDLMTDHFDVGFYLSLHVGKWDKPFTVC